MAAEADSVVVSLIADTRGFDTGMKASAAQFVDSSRQVTSAANDVERAAGDVYTAHNKMGLATNNARIAQFELEHVIRGSVDSYASGASAAQIFAQHIASVAEAATFMGGSLGAVGEVISGPWGIAMTAAIALGVGLLARHKEENETLDTAVEKLKKHHDATLLSNEADQIWSHTVDGLIERLDRLNQITGKKLELPNIVNQQSFSDAQAQVASLNRLIDKTEADPTSTPEQINKLYEALAAAVTNLRLQTSVLGQQAGEVFSDLTKKADDWAQYQQNKLRFITGSHPELLSDTAQIEVAFDAMKKAVDDAAKAGVPFDAFTRRVDALNQRLADSPGSVNSYIAGLKGIAAELEKIASLKPEDAIKKFESAVIGTEGLGHNPKSSAFGYGQFLAQQPGQPPSEFQSYFRKLYPDQASQLSTQAIDDLRANKEVATAIIDAATQDYVKVLKAAGQQITEAGLYTVHLLGPAGARKLFAASPDTPTSSLFSNSVLSGNPFLRGTAGDARAAIAGRIGDSNSAVTAGAVALYKEQATWAEKNAELVGKDLDTEQKVSVVKEGQVSLASELIGHQQTIAQMIEQRILPGEVAWLKLSAQITASEKEINKFGEAFIDDVLNPDNWTSFGNIAHTVLHDIEMEFIKLAAINPLKNLLLGQNNPTLGSVFSTLLGGLGGIGGLTAGKNAQDAAAFIPARAGGGPVAAGQTYIVGEDGPEIFTPSSSGAILPNNRAFMPSNGRALSPMGAMGPGMVLIGVQANDYFDAKVLKVSGPVIAQSSVAAANGGATISRNRLATEVMHRLD